MEFRGGLVGPQGETGATFTPHMADDGTLSWTNDRELTNPQSKNLTGPQGRQGIQGPVGPQGPAGRDAEAETMLQMDIDSLF
ncbi:hypothetical protein [Mitsuokella sp.]|uniref:hypothetical protein n=1 Tax=Mitsuokella sp. TaxID=2049034 RepID=UPI003D7EA11D